MYKNSRHYLVHLIWTFFCIYTADIAGILWTESRGGMGRMKSVGSSLGLASMRRAFDSSVSLKSLEQTNDASNVVASLNYQPIRWRDIKSINQDPDSAKGPRLALMEEAGFTMAAGITFQYMHHQGIVVFLTTVKDKTDDGLTCVTNSAYLYQSAQFIGAALSLAEIRRATLAERFKLKDKCYSMHECSEYQRLSLASVEEGKGGAAAHLGKGSGGTDANEHPAAKHAFIPHQVVAYSNKLRGGSMQIPPSLSWTQSLWTVFGSFVGLLVLSSLNEYYKLLSDEEYFLLIGPFGAMCTLMYGLSAAPASQPRNAVMGQAAGKCVFM